MSRLWEEEEEDSREGGGGVGEVVLQIGPSESELPLLTFIVYNQNIFNNKKTQRLCQILLN